MYADYGFYTDTFKGATVKDAETYERLAVEASALIDWMVTSKIDVSAPYMDKVKMAECALVEISHEQTQCAANPVKSAERVGDHSVNYAVSMPTQEQYSSMKADKIRIYLGNTGLLYRGVQ